MKKQILSLLLCGAMLFSLCPQSALAAGNGETETECICASLCTTETIEEDCPVCGAENADFALCEGETETAVLSNAEAVYRVAGDAALCDSNWDSGDNNNRMTHNPDTGLYEKTFSSVASGDYQLKVVKNGETWYGTSDDSNFVIRVSAACDVTITFDAETETVGVRGNNVVQKTWMEINGIYVVGNGSGDWLNGASWDPAAEENKMTEISSGIYEITYADVPAGEDYEFKFAANGNWSHIWGGGGAEGEAVYNSNPSITFRLRQTSNVTLRLDLTNYDHATKSGAVYSIIGAGVPYLAANGSQQSCNSYTVVDTTTTTWNEGWYVAEGEVTIPDSVTLTGNVHLILTDGCSLNVDGGISGNEDSALTIYAQSTEDRMGNLTVTGGGQTEGVSAGIFVNGEFTLNGGNVISTGGTADNESNGIRANSGIKISGGSITATGGAATGGQWTTSCGIYTEYGVEISGGTVTATGGIVTATDGSETGLTVLSSGIYTNFGVKISGGTVTATGSAVTASGDSTQITSEGIVVIRGDITITGGSVTATGGAATGGKRATSHGIYVYGESEISACNITITGDAQVTATAGPAVAESGAAVAESGPAVAESCGIVAICIVTGVVPEEQGPVGSITIVDNAQVIATGGTVTGGEMPFTYGIGASGGITVNGGRVIATGGMVTGDEMAISNGIYAYGGVTVNGGHVIAETQATSGTHSALGVAPALPNTTYWWRTAETDTFTTSADSAYFYSDTHTYVEITDKEPTCVTFDKTSYTYGEDMLIMVDAPQAADETELTVSDIYDSSEAISFVEKNSDGKYVYKYTMPNGGDRKIKAEYLGSTNYSSSSETKTVTVEKLLLDVTVTPSASSYQYQDEVKLKLSVTGVPTGGSTSIRDFSIAVKSGDNIVSSMPVSDVVPFTDKEISLGKTLGAGTYDIYVALDDDNYTVPMGVIMESVTVARRAPVFSDFYYWCDFIYGTYDKTEKTVTITPKAAVAADMGTVTVEYRRDDEIVTAPVDAGWYIVYVCVDDSGSNITSGTVEIVGYGINQKTPDASDMTVKINGEAPLSEYPYTGKPVTATVTSADEGAFGVTAVSYYKKNSEGNFVLMSEAPTDGGSYKVKVTTAESTNYSAATDVEVAAFDITKADPEITLTNSGAVYYYDSAITVAGGVYPKLSIYDTAKRPTGTLTAELIDTSDSSSKVLPADKVHFLEEYGSYDVTFEPKTDFSAGKIYKLKLTYGGDENYNTATYTSGNYEIAKSNVIFEVSEKEHQYSPGEERGIKVQPKIGGMSEPRDVQNMPEGGIVVKYYAVDENDGKLASITPVQKAIAPGRYLYVISLSPEASESYQCYDAEYAVTDTVIPDFAAYGNIGFMDIKSNNEAAQKPIYFDNAVVNAHMTDTVTNPLNNPNASTVTYESKNTSVAQVNASTGEVTIRGAGSAVIVATSTKENASDVYASYTLNVTKEVVTVTAVNPLIDYGTEVDDIPCTYSVSKAGVTLGGTAVYTTAYTKGSGCGQYSIGISGLTSDIYELVFVPGTITVTPKSLTTADLDITAADKVYDGSDKAELTATVKDTAIVPGDIVTVLASGRFESADAGDAEQTVSYTVTGLSGTHSGNYTLTGELTGTTTAKIAKAPVTVSVPAATTYVYDGEDKSVNAVAYANGIYFDKFNVTYNGSTEKPKSVGTYTVGVAITDSNYDLSGDISAQLIIREAQQDFFSIEGVADTVTYGDANFNLQADGTDAGSTVKYSLISGDAVTITKDGEVTITGVGSVTVQATSTLANHTEKIATRTFTVKPKTLNVTATPTAADKVYDGTKTVDVTLTLDGVASGDDVAASYTSAVMASADVENNKTVFVNGITLSGAEKGLYQLSTNSVQTSINVTKKPITAISFTAADKVYDGTAKADYTITNLEGVLSDDKNFVTVIGNAEFADANAGENKTVTLSGLTLSGTKSGNYALNVTGDVTAQASISKAKVEFTLGTLEYTYDGTKKTVPVTAAVDGVAYTDYTVAYQKDGSGAETVNAGEYDVVITLGDTTNYETNYTPKTLKIVKASQSAITITGLIGTIDYGAVFALSAVGGNGDGAVTWASSNPDIAEIDTNTGVVTIKGTGSPVTITATKAGSENFGGEQTAAVTFTPIKKSVGFRVTNLTHVYDGGAKSVTVTPSVGSENFSITYTDENGNTVDAPTDAGIYYADVHATGHYDGYTTAVLTIKNAAVNTSGYTFEVADAVYGSAPVVTQPESTVYPSGVTAKITYTGSGIYSETAEQPKNAGSYMAILTISGDNYETVRLTDSFVITKAVLTAKPNDSERSYGEQNPVFTVSYSGFVNGDDESAVMIAPTMTTNATVSSGTGTYAIRASGGYAENYTFSYEDGALTVGTASGGNFYIHGGQSNPYVGHKFTLTAYYNNEKPTVEWSSDNTAVATVNAATGEVEIVGDGTATITAKMNDSRFDNSLTATFTLNASYLPETQSPIYFDSLLVEKYVTDASFTNPAKGMSDGAAVKYTSSNPEVAAVDEASGEVTILKAGTTVIKATSTKFNCADVYASYTLTVKKAPITVSAKDITLTYGDSFTATDITISDGVTADTLDGTLGFTTKYAVGKSVGEYEVTPYGLTSDTYDITFESGTITVNEKTLNAADFEITAANKGYDGTNTAEISATVKADALVGADNLRAEVCGHFADENAGADKAISYEITSLSGKGFENYVLGSDVNTATVTADITPAKVTFFVSEETTRIYDGTVQKVDISAMALGNVFGESNYTVYYQADGEEKTTEPKNAGEYTVTIELTDESGNYEAIQPTAKLIIKVNAAASLVISGSNRNVTVDDAFTLRAYYGNETPEVEWTSSDETVAKIDSITGEVTILKAGTATITATAKDANYGSAEFELEAAKKRINIKAPAGELVKTYNGERQDINFTSSDIDLEEKNVTVNVSYVLLTDPGVTEPKQVGTYTVSYEIDDERYTADGNVMLTINKANVVVKAKNISKEYGEEPEYEIEIVSGENVTDTDEMTALAEFASEGAEKTANVGTYDITVTLASDGDENRNFVVSDEKGTLMVTKAPLTITVKDVSREYGAENPALEAEYEGFKNDETADVLTGELVFAYDESINTETAVGAYSGKTTASGLSSDNYEITFVPGNVTVTKIGVKASAGTSRSSYLTVKLDKAVPGLTANNFVVKNGDEIIALTEVTASSDNKTYTLKGSFSTSVTYTVEISLAGTESDATHEIISEPLAIKPSSGSTGGGGGGGGSSVATTYTVTFETNGGNKIDSVKVSKNGTLSKPTDPTKEGFDFDGWYSDKELKTAYNFDTKVTKSFTLYAKWTEKAPEPDKPTEPTEPTEPTAPEWKNPFTDVKKSDWFYTSVEYAVNNKLMNGTTATTFAPSENLTRAMLVAILYRAEGEPAVNKSIPFSDVAANAYYANAVIWAQQNGIVNGVTENAFAPDDNITREQIAAIMFRYAKYKGYDVSVGESTNILSYTDAESISEYAISAMQYAVGSGLMKGKTESTINPLDNATRAEIAAILQRFIEANK